MQLTKLERTHRIDSEFYSKENLKFDKWISSVNHLPLTKISNVSDGNHMAISEKFIEKGIPYYRGQNIHSFFIEDTDPICIDGKTYSLSTMKRSHLKKGDVLLSIVGTIGGISLVTTDNKATCNCKLAILRKNGEVNEKYLAIYLSCRYGQSQIERYIRGAVQKGLILEDMDQLSVPIMSFDFQNKIASLVIEAKTKNGCSKEKYTQAENLLISELGLENFNPSNEKISIKSLKESFLKTGRLDSEYYQTKYDDYLKKVFSYKNGYELLGECCTIKDKNFMPKDEEEYRYIELANVRNNAQISDCDILLGKELPTRARRKVNTGDVIVSSIEGSLESCALITEEYNNSLCSTGFYVVNSEKMNSESLLTVFKSSLILNLMKKGCSGTILTNIVKEEFEKLPIPLLKQGVQDEIASYIKQSMEYSKKAKELLEISTKSVEIAIDKDEQAAHNFLEQNRTEQNKL